MSAVHRFARTVGNVLYPPDHKEVLRHHLTQLCLNRIPSFPHFDTTTEDVVDELVAQMRQWTQVHLLHEDGRVLAAVSLLMMDVRRVRALWDEAKRHSARVWTLFRWAVRVRPYALHWLEEHVKVQCAPGGAGRKRDRAAYEAWVSA